jgi:hypothetical protein
LSTIQTLTSIIADPGKHPHKDWENTIAIFSKVIDLCSQTINCVTTLKIKTIMEFDFKLDKIIEIFDLIKAMSWGAMPLWFSLTLPVIYIAYKKLLPDSTSVQQTNLAFWQRVTKLMSLPKISEWVIYISLILFIVGTVTLKIDQVQKERIRNNGQRIKQFCLATSLYAVNIDSLQGKKMLSDIKEKDIRYVLEIFPSEFIKVGGNTLLLVDSASHSNIFNLSEKLLNSYLTNSTNKSGFNYTYDTLFIISKHFTVDVINKLLADSTKKYNYTILNGKPAIEIK